MNSRRTNDNEKDTFLQAMAIEDELERIDSLISVAKQSKGKDKEKALTAALDTVLEIPVDAYPGFEKIERFGQQQIIIRLIPHLTHELRLKLRDKASLFNNRHTRAWALTFLIPYLEGDVQAETLQTAINEALLIEDELDRANTLSHLGPYIKGEEIDRILTAVEGIKIRMWRSRVLDSLVPNATLAQQERILEATIQLAEQWGDTLPSYPFMSEEEALEIRAIELDSREWYQALVLRALIPHSIGAIRERALEMVLAFEDDEALAASFADISDILEDEMLERVLEKVQAIGSDEYRAKALAALARKFPDSQKSDLIAQARLAVAHVKGPEDRAETLFTIGQACEGQERVEVLSQALNSTLEIEWEESRYDCLARYCPSLPDELREQLLEVFSSFKEDDWREAIKSRFIL